MTLTTNLRAMNERSALRWREANKWSFSVCLSYHNSQDLCPVECTAINFHNFTFLKNGFERPLSKQLHAYWYSICSLKDGNVQKFIVVSALHNLACERLCNSIIDIFMLSQFETATISANRHPTNPSNLTFATCGPHHAAINQFMRLKTNPKTSRCNQLADCLTKHKRSQKG